MDFKAIILTQGERTFEKCPKCGARTHMSVPETKVPRSRYSVYCWKCRDFKWSVLVVSNKETEG